MIKADSAYQIKIIQGQLIFWIWFCFTQIYAPCSHPAKFLDKQICLKILHISMQGVDCALSKAISKCDILKTMVFFNASPVF